MKLKLLTDTYILQAKRAKFGPTYASSALCPLCKEEDETREHFLLKCSSLKLVRDTVLSELAAICQDELHLNLYELSTESQLQTILDVSKVSETLTTKSNSDSMFKFEYMGRKLCFALHSARQRILSSVADKSKQGRQCLNQL